MVLQAFLNYVILVSVKWYLIVFLILNLSYAERVFMTSVVIYIFCWVSENFAYGNNCVPFLVLIYKKLIYILDRNSLLDICLEQTSPPR